MLLYRRDPRRCNAGSASADFAEDPRPGESRDPLIRFRDAEEWIPAFAGTPVWVVPLADFVERPDRAAHLVEQFGRVMLGAQRAGIDQDDFARDRLEGGAEMLHRFDAHRRVAGRVDAERGELAEIDRLAVVRDDDDVDAADL